MNRKQAKRLRRELREREANNPFVVVYRKIVHGRKHGTTVQLSDYCVKGMYRALKRAS